jgi:hypothetical protein
MNYRKERGKQTSAMVACVLKGRGRSHGGVDPARNHEKRRVVVTANIKKTKLVGIRPPPWFSLKEESPLPA